MTDDTPPAATDGGTRPDDAGDAEDPPAFRSTEDDPVEAAVVPNPDPTPAIRPVDPSDEAAAADAVADPEADEDATETTATLRDRFAAVAEDETVTVTVDPVDADADDRVTGTVQRVATDTMGARVVLVRDGRRCVKVSESLSSGALRASEVTRGGDATFLGPVVDIERA